MQLFIDSYGAFLGTRDGMFFIKSDSQTSVLPARKIHAIYLTKGVSVSTNALAMAIKEGVPVMLIDGIGRPIGQVWSGQFGSVATIRKNQAFFTTHRDGLKWVVDVIAMKVQQQIGFAYQVGFATPEVGEKVEKMIRPAEDILQKLKQWSIPKEATQEELSAMKATLRGWEGSASRAYFKVLAACMPEYYRFSGRGKRPAKDPFNCALNYLYGMLYNMVELAQMQAGIDPYVGVLHAEEHNRPAMVFDCIELYRVWAENVAVRLCKGHILKPHHFMEKEGGIWLAPEGKPVVVHAFDDFLEERIDYKDRQFKRITAMSADMVRLASYLKKWRL
ncbi:CRISPR-associated endonuclease Cas1 [Algivirga pacifica]|uniref:CRISPR-associated endonuclease Cas1 n=1 Tax=Algivirga pacifica TaxID=1162670 RepID=A0ABP9D663_9BACT